MQEKINDILKSHGLKRTPQRIAVLSAIIGNRTHPSAEALIREIRKKHPSISTGTIYNILDTFVSKGIITKLHTGDNVMRYDPVTDEHHHIFFVDSKEIMDYYDEELSALVRKHLEKSGRLKDIKIKSIKINLVADKKTES